MQETIALMGAAIGAALITILVGLFRHDARGRPRTGDLMTAAVCGAILGGLIGYAVVPVQAPIELVPTKAQQEVQRRAFSTPEADLEPAMGSGAPVRLPQPDHGSPEEKR